MAAASEKGGRARERAALVIFLLLVIAGGIVLFGYFSTGRDWSVAATFLDDSVGSLDDYAVVVFAGTSEPDRPTERGGVAEKDASSMSSRTPSGGRSPEGLPTEGISQLIMSVYQRFDKLKDAPADAGVYVSDVRDLYELKGASVVTLRLDDPAYYAEPVILHSKNRSFGVFSVSSYTSRAQMKKTVASLADAGADSVICIAPRTAMLSTRDGIDVVVLTDEPLDNPEFMQYDKDNTGVLVVSSPERGSVGVVIFSSNNVPSFKTVEEL